MIHRGDVGTSLEGIERKLNGREAVALDEELLAIPTPGHTPATRCCCTATGTSLRAIILVVS